MEIDRSVCDYCVSLQAAYLEKTKLIHTLKMHLKNLTSYLSSNCEDIFQLLTSLKEWRLLVDTLNCQEKGLDKSFGDKVESKSVCATTEDNLESSDENKVCDQKTISPDSTHYEDYVYDETYQMYYSKSTGYYYDEKNGLLYDPTTYLYYKYDYETKEYKSVSAEVQLDATKSQTICETVVKQVNDLNINDDIDEKYDEKLEEDTSGTIVTNVEVNKNVSTANDNGNSIVNSSYEETKGLIGSAKDWQPEDGSNITVKDMVKQVVEECMNKSDYVYDENCKMYYSSATGYYYDSVRNLLYDPYNMSYYSYNFEKETYEYYCSADNSKSNKKEASAVGIDKEKVELRKQYWKKKLKKKQSKDENESLEQSTIEEDDQEFSSPEDGEIFTSDEETESAVCLVKSPVKACDAKSAKNCDRIYAPSIRAIVKQSTKLDIGSLVLITCTGGTIGRDTESDIHLPDLSVSKLHAEVAYCSENNKYNIQDLGSQNGTFINEQRLSKPKEKSEPQELNHGDELLLGSCKLLLHIHEMYETCDDCEPGQVLAKISSESDSGIHVLSREERESARREQLQKMKKKYGLSGYDSMLNTKSDQKYEDKAKIRRELVGSDNPYEKTEESSLESSISEKNKGYQMLKKMGWKEGQSLGTTDIAITEPIPLRPWTSKGGLGSSQFCLGDESAKKDKKKLRWIKAQERYLQISG